MKLRGQQFIRMLRLALGWGSLGLYLALFTPVGPLFTALVGRFDPNHQIEFASRDGDVGVVMHHEQACRNHHHGLVARALITFAQPAGQTDPDHVVQFHNMPAAGEQQKVTAPAAPANNLLGSDLFAGGDAPVGATANSVLVLSPRPPLGHAAQLVCLRSILLRI